MFSTWAKEKAVTVLVEAAQALADKLEDAKRHILDSHAAAAQVWAETYRAEGVDLEALASWTPAARKRFAGSVQTRINALRKARAYDSSDGLAIWLHTARALDEARIMPPVREIWAHLALAGPNADAMAEEQLAEAGLPAPTRRPLPRDIGLEAPEA